MLYVAVAECADGKREMHIAAHALCRKMLYALCDDFSPEDITYTPIGKPYLKSGRVHFSLSHSHGAVCCAVSTDKKTDRDLPQGTKQFDVGLAPVGADIELIRAGYDVSRIAKSFFTKKECEYIEEKNSLDRFFYTYTRKEAMVKRSGVGLAGMRAADSRSDELFLHTEQITLGGRQYMLSVCS